MTTAFRYRQPSEMIVPATSPVWVELLCTAIFLFLFPLAAVMAQPYPDTGQTVDRGGKTWEIIGENTEIRNEDAVDLADAITVLQIFNNVNVPFPADCPDVNNDLKAGLEEVVYILQYCSGVRVPDGTWKRSMVVPTVYGGVEGQTAGGNTLTWKGIPFARPPVGDLRWQKPVAPEQWVGTMEAHDFCEPCSQWNADYSDIVGSEDCLYLNVWRPDSDAADLPVYFWIHGGGNSIGSARGPEMDGANLAANGNMVVVSISYRLGPMGWFANPVLRDGIDPMSDSGNYGTLDIIMALQWVRDNIGAFGGNPGNVTIAGESAGACDVISLLMSPAAAGLFHRAIAQSGPMENSPSRQNGDADSDAVIDALMAGDGLNRAEMTDHAIADYLRGKSPGDIISAYARRVSGMIDFPNIFKDGAVIHEEGYPGAFQSGEYNRVPVILGSTKEEHKAFMTAQLYVFNTPGKPTLIMTPCNYQNQAEFWTDFFWKRSAVDNVAQYLIQHQTDVYAYEFLYGAYHYVAGTCASDPAVVNAWPDYSPSGGANYALWFGAMHTLDIPFFFGNYYFVNDVVTGLLFRGDNYSGYHTLSSRMMTYVSQFARNGVPGQVDGVLWESWTGADGPRILFDANATEAQIEMSVP